MRCTIWIFHPNYATILGHARLDTTARYSRPSAEDLEEAAAHKYRSLDAIETDIQASQERLAKWLRELF